MKPGGTFVVFSHAAPDERMTYLELDAYNWTVESKEFGESTLSALLWCCEGLTAGRDFVRDDDSPLLVLCAVRPSVTEVEGLPADNPNNLLYMYTCTKMIGKSGK